MAVEKVTSYVVNAMGLVAIAKNSIGVVLVAFWNIASTGNNSITAKYPRVTCYVNHSRNNRLRMFWGCLFCRV